LVAEDTDLEERSRDEFNLDGLEIFEHFYIDIPDEAVVELEGENRIDREYLETEIGEHVRLASFENFLEYVPLLKRKVDDAKLGTYGSFEEKSIRPDKNKKKPIRNTLKDFVNKTIEELEEHARKAQMLQIAESENNEVKEIVENEFMEALETIE